jgi:dipeptide transport system substrate-binding protein
MANRRSTGIFRPFQRINIKQGVTGSRRKPASIPVLLALHAAPEYECWYGGLMKLTERFAVQGSGLFVSVLFLSIALLATGESASAAAKTLVYCSEGSPSTFNPQLATDGPTFNASARAVYNRLVEFERGGTKVQPGLAESWTVSKDGKQFTFKLRPNVAFQTTAYFKPTRPLNADDILFTFNRMLKADHPYHKVSGGTYEYFTSMDMQNLIKNIEKVDEHTVRFDLSRPEVPFLANLAMDFASILSAEYGEQLLKAKTPERMDNEPVGTGPFIFQKYVKDSTIRYIGNPTYFEGKPAVEQLVFAITKDASVRVQKAKAGECDIVAEPPTADLKALRTNTALTVLEQEGLNVGYLAFNVEKPPFDKVEVRQAISHALNRASYIDAIYLGNAVLAKTPIPPSMWSHSEALMTYDYNQEKAKQLLKKVGLEKGFDATLWWIPISRPYNPNGKKMAEMMQADLAKVGIKVNLVSFDWSTYLAKARNGEHQMIMSGWTGDNGDPDNFLSVLLGCPAVKQGSNVARWCRQSYQHLIELARTTPDMKKRTQYYHEAQGIFGLEAPWVPLAHAKVFKIVSRRVVGYKMSPFGTDSFYGVSLK